MQAPVDAFACRNIHCEDPEHKLQIDTFVEEILELLNEAGLEALPHSKPSLNGNSKRKKLAGWKEFVEPFQESARFWHSIWISAGKPINTELHQIMKRTRNKYHYQIRRCRRIEEFIRNRKIVENCLDDDMDLFKEIKSKGQITMMMMSLLMGQLRMIFQKSLQKSINPCIIEVQMRKKWKTSRIKSMTILDLRISMKLTKLTLLL